MKVFSRQQGIMRGLKFYETRPAGNYIEATSPMNMPQ